MPRISRQSMKTSYFHVITQGIEKRFIFNNHHDIKYYIKLIYKFSEIQQIKIIAYCIMNNKEQNLSLRKIAQILNISREKIRQTYIS